MNSLNVHKFENPCHKAETLRYEPSVRLAFRCPSTFVRFQLLQSGVWIQIHFVECGWSNGAWLAGDINRDVNSHYVAYLIYLFANSLHLWEFSTNNCFLHFQLSPVPMSRIRYFVNELYN